MKKLVLKKLLTKKTTYIVLAGVLAAGAGGSLLLSPGKSVATMAAEQQVMEDTFWEDGMVRAQNRSVISADVDGKVLTLSVQEGQSVVAGQELLVMDTSGLEAQRAQCQAEKLSVLAAWEQSRDQTKQQIAAIEAQRASYNAANISAQLGEQIRLLEKSIDPSTVDGVAYSYQQLLAITNARLQFTNVQMLDASRQAPAEVQALQTQLETAKAQQLAIENQQKQYEIQKKAQILELEAQKAALPVGGDPAPYDAIIQQLNSGGDSYASMLAVANDQVARLGRDVSDAQNQIPQAIETLRAQQLALESERTTLEEQYKQYRLNMQTQILSLTAQQEQAAVASASGKKARGKLGEQIELLEQSLQDGSGSASYYAAQIAIIDAGLSDVERRIGLARIVAPIDGVIGAMDVAEGQYLQAGFRITEIVDPDSLQVECMMLTDDADSVPQKAGVRIVWERRDGDMEYKGEVQGISSLAVNSISSVGLNEQRVKVTLAADFTAENHPKDGYQVRVEFTTASQTALSVPRSAVVKTDSGDAVYVVKDGRAVLTHVVLGMESGNRVAVVSGLKENDIVIDNPEADGVQPGSQVRADQ